jgi:hypothetical protein
MAMAEGTRTRTRRTSSAPRGCLHSAAATFGGLVCVAVDASQPTVRHPEPIPSYIDDGQRIYIYSYIFPVRQ